MTRHRYLSDGERAILNENAEFSAPTWKTLRDRDLTARKSHRCDSCDGWISPGQRYRQIVSLVDGDFQIIRACLPASRCLTEEWLQ